MYIFVRFVAILSLILGGLLTLLGIGLGIYTVIYSVQPNLQLTEWVNTNLMLQETARMEARGLVFYGGVLSAMTFFWGITQAAFGQFLLIFVDIANQTAETNLLLQQLLMRRQAAPATPAQAPALRKRPASQPEAPDGYEPLPPTRVRAPRQAVEPEVAAYPVYEEAPWRDGDDEERPTINSKISWQDGDDGQKPTVSSRTNYQ